MYVTPEFALSKENIEQENVGLCFAPKEDSERTPREQKGTRGGRTGPGVSRHRAPRALLSNHGSASTLKSYQGV